MKLIISICLFIILPSFILVCGSPNPRVPRNFVKEVTKLSKSARKGLKINNALKVSRDFTFLGDGGTGFVIEGLDLEENIPVAIKFVADDKIKQAKNEFKILSYLEADKVANKIANKNTTVEQYGIPAVYYYGAWEGYTIIAITKCDKDLIDIGNEGGLNDPLDVLILFRNFVIQSKYMHAHGVKHDDIKPENILVSGHKSFIIDFNRSSKMSNDSGACTVDYAARVSHFKKPRVAKSDWESFLYSMCYVLRVPLGWFHPQIRNLVQQEKEIYCGSFKTQTDKIRATINDFLPNGPVKDVINEFADQVFTDDSVKFPNYNHLHEFISGRIDKLHPKDSELPPMFSWLDEKQIQKAKEDFNSIAPLNIKDIVEPSKLNFKKFPYPNVRELVAIEGQSSGSRKKSGGK